MNTRKSFEERYDQREQYQGTVMFSRCSGGGSHLWGEPFVHHGHIIMQVHRAVAGHDCGRDFVYPTEEIVEVWMSYNQFATAISCMGVSPGAQCTIKTARTGPLVNMPRPGPQEAEAKRVQDAYRAQVNAGLASLDDKAQLVEAALLLAKVSEKRRKEVMGLVTELFDTLRATAPFMLEQFQGACDDTVAQAKVAVSTHVDQVLRTAGAAALQHTGVHGVGVVPQLPSGQDVQRG